MSSYSWTQIDNYQLLSFSGWQRFRVGFIGKPANMAAGSADHELIAKLLGWNKLLLLRQVHGDNIVEATVEMTTELLQQKRTEGDGFIADLSAEMIDVTLGVTVADCLAVALKANNRVALVHVGWRGLANGILIKALKLLGPNDQPLEAVFFPAAGKARYEVGSEVISALGEYAEYQNSTADKYLLSLEASALKQLEKNWVGKISFSSPELCTISDNRFHSYRRDGESSGRNLAFIQFS